MHDELRDHFDVTDLTDAVETATWETDVDPEPMIVTSVRLPKSLLDWLRERASTENVKPTTLIRRWIEDQRDASVADTRDASVARLADRVSRLETLAVRVVTGDRAADGDSMTELLEALQASVEAARDKQDPTPPDQQRRGA